MKETVDALVEDYIFYASLEGKSKLSGDYNTGNKMSKKLDSLFVKLEQDLNLAKDVIGILLQCDIERARSLAAVDALRLGIYTNEAIIILILENISRKRQDILGFGCEMALKIYRGEVPGRTL